MKQEQTAEQVQLLSTIGFYTIEARAVIAEIDRIIKGSVNDEAKRRQMWATCKASIFQEIAQAEASSRPKLSPIERYGLNRGSRPPGLLRPAATEAGGALSHAAQQ